MDVHASEQEQIEALKKWWKDNGSSVVTGLLLGLSALLGVKAWFGYQESQALNASNIYAQMLAAAGGDRSEQVRDNANELITNYTGTGYAPLAALLLAQLAVEQGEPDAARAQLRWALDHADSEEMRHTARTRLIRLMIAEGDYAGAEQLLAATPEASGYGYLYAELKGDLAVAQGEPAVAASAYRTALDSMPAQSPQRAFLKAKYEDVAGADNGSS
jgi:predicted negative regulator of RcsB-dependent stress response